MNKVIVLCAALFASACGQTQPPPAATTEAASVSAIEIRDAWAGPTPGGVTVSAGYLTIVNPTGVEDQLVAVSSARATRAEIHDVNMDAAGVVRMRAINALPVPASGDVTLGPGGMHLMFFGVTQPFVAGEEIPVRLTFANAGEVDVSLPVRAGATHGSERSGSH